MQIRERVPLSPLTTLGIGGAARRFVEAHDERAIVDAVRAAESSGEPLFVLGGGSNVVVSDEGFDGLVVQVASRGARVSEASDLVTIEVAAGEPWDPFVERCVSEGWSGIECLAGIPGLVGATPIQNVGAYGREVREVITRVRVFDRASSSIAHMPRDACGFRYRHSIFKGDPRFVVLAVTFALRKSNGSAPIAYAELARALGVAEGDRAPLSAVHDAVVALRRGKGMVVDARDPDSKSAGSFFTNPILGDADANALEARLRSLGLAESAPRFKADDGRTKISAAWLIERAGFAKGYAHGAAGISTKHALSLVNRGGATASELLGLASEIQARVREAFGIELALEPVVVGSITAGAGPARTEAPTRS